MARTLLKIEEVAVLCGVSVQTINNWYRFKRENPTNEYARLLPDYETIGGHGQRFWDKSDVNSLVSFKDRMPKGCKGVMGKKKKKYVKR